MKRYKEVYQDWVKDPEIFWMEASEKIAWIKKPTRAADDPNNPLCKWFADGLLNTCYNALDRHVKNGRGEQAAIIYDSPVTGVKEQISYAMLLENVSLLAGALVEKGIRKGDRVIVYMPMVPEAIVAMLAIARIGAIHSVVFGGFASNELATRIDDAMPKAIIAGSCGIELNKIIEYKPLLDQAINLAKYKPDFCVVFQRKEKEANLIPGRDFDWTELISKADRAECCAVSGDHPVYILYTSGTTGQPKGVVRPTAGHLVALYWTMKNIYNVEPGDVFWAASDVGWVVGHSYICYAPLIHGNTTVLFEGKPVGTPDAGTFWRVMSEYKVKSFFTAPTAFRAIKREDPNGELVRDYDLSNLGALFLAGERADPDTILWAQKHLNVPVVDHWWQTETGYSIVGNPLGIEYLPIKLGSPSVPMPGYDVRVLDENGYEKQIGELGSIAIKLPLPPGNLPTLWNAHERFLSSYLETFPGFYETGDAGYRDTDGYIYIMARTDDVINVAGHRLSTGAMEEVLAGHIDVAECAVIGVKDDLKGQIPLGLLCINSGVIRSEEDIINECIQLIREKIGPIAAFKTAVIVERLPKTRSGKILRAIMVKIANGDFWSSPPTIDDSEILNEIELKFRSIGYSRKKINEA